MIDLINKHAWFVLSCFPLFHPSTLRYGNFTPRLSRNLLHITVISYFLFAISGIFNNMGILHYSFKLLNIFVPFLGHLLVY